MGIFQPLYGQNSGTGSTTPNGGTMFSAYISAVTNYAAPTGAVAFLLQTDSSFNTDFVRWRIGAAANASMGHQLEAGRDSGLIPFGATISVFPNSATQAIQLTWLTVT